MRSLLFSILFIYSTHIYAATCEEMFASAMQTWAQKASTWISSAPNCSHEYWLRVLPGGQGKFFNLHVRRMCPGWSVPTLMYIGEQGICDMKNSSLPANAAYSVPLPKIKCGSIVQVENQVVGENVPIVGATFTLNYFTTWSYGRNSNFSVVIGLSGTTPRHGIAGFDIQLKNGSTILDATSFANTLPNQKYIYNWNGLDSLGQPVLGSYKIDTLVNENRGSFYFPVTSSILLGGLQAKLLGIGGWLPSNYVFFDRSGERVIRGDGRISPVKYKDLVGNQVIVAEEDGSKVYIFDSKGRHLYTKLGLLGTIVETFTYDSQGRIQSLIEPFSRITYFNRDALGELSSITAPDGTTTQITLDSNGYVNKISDPEGKEHVITYYGSKGLIYTFKRPGGDISTFHFDSDGNLQKDSHSGGYFFDLVRNIQSTYTHEISSVSAMGRSTQILDTIQDENLTRLINHPSGMQDKDIINDYPSSGQRNTQNLRSSVLSYINKENDSRFSNLAKRPTLVAAQIAGQWRQIAYSYNVTLSDINDPFSIVNYRVDQAVSGQNTKRTSVFNPSTKTFTNTTFLGRTSSESIDSYQRLISHKRGNEAPVEYIYTNENLTEVKQGLRSATFNYDSLGRLSSIQPMSGAEVFYGYDSAGRVISTSRDGSVTNITYDPNGNVTSVQPFLRPLHNFSYNGHGLPSLYEPPSLAGVTPVGTGYLYNLDKQLTQIVRPDGKNITFNYNPSTGLLGSYLTSDGTFSVSMNTSNSSPSSILAPSGGISTSFAYYGDKIAKTSITKTGLGSIGAYEAKFAAGTHLQNSEIVTAGSTNFTTNYLYNDDEQLLSAGAITFSYSPLEGYLYGTSLIEGTGVVTDSYTYNNYGEVVAYGSWYGSNLLYSYDLTRDTAGRVQVKDQQLNGITSSYAYAYDNLDRLAEVAIPGPTTVSTYTYDSNGNRTGGFIGSQVTSANYDDQDRMTSYNVFSYAYTKNGDLLSKTNTITSEVTSYSYDVFGNLRSVTLPTSSMITYDVDALNRRVLKSVGGVVQKRWIFRDQYRIAAQLTGVGVMEKQFVYGSKKNIPDYMIYNNEKYRIISDNLGSLRLVVKVSNGTIAQRMNHDEFGRVTEDTNPGFTPFGFAGGMYDSDTKLVRFGARDYDADIGRWVSKDPISFNAGDANLYAYVNNDPINLIDPSGHFAWMPGLIGGGIGGVAGFVGAYNVPGATTGSIMRATAIGAAPGFLSAYGGMGLGGLIGFSANVAAQVGDGKSLKCVDYGSAGVSALAGIFGTYVGGAAASRIQIPYPVLGQSLSSVMNSGTKSHNIISNGIGGVAGGAADIYGNQIFYGQ